MKLKFKLLVATTIITLMSVGGVMLYQDQYGVYRVYETPSFKATFYNAKCSTKAVLDQIPQENQKELGSKLKQGEVYINHLKEDRKFCYVLLPGQDTEATEVAFVLDEKGISFPLFMDKK